MDTFVCLKETHDYGKILGICFNGQCNDSIAQFCLKCVMESHQDCKGDCYQFSQMNEIFQLIIENMNEQEIQIDREYEIVKKKYEIKKKEIMMKKGEFILYQESNTSHEYVTLRTGIQNIKQEYEKLKSECLNFNLQKGYRLLKNKKWREASEQLNLSPKDQDYEVGQFFKSLALAQLNQFSENHKYIEKPECLNSSLILNLQSYCDKLKQKGQEDTICKMIQGIILSFNKNYQKAIEIYDQLLAIDNSLMYTHYLKCVSLVKLQNFEQAKKVIIAMKQIDSNYYLTFIIEGYVLYQSRQFEQALQCYNSAKQINQQYSSAYFYGGMALLQLDKNQEAINYFQKTADLDNKNAKCFFYLGNALIRLQKKEESLSCYEMAIQLDNNYLHAYLNLGITLALLSKIEQSNQTLDKLISLDPKFYQAYSIKGENLMKQKKYSEALEQYDKVLKLNYLDSDSLKNKGLCLYQLNDFSQAIEVFQTLLLIDSNNKEGLYFLGICLKSVKRFEESINSFQNLQKLDKSFQRVHYQKGYSHYQIQQYTQAIKCFEQAIQQDEQHFDAYLRLGDCLIKMKKYYEAIAYYDQVIWMNPLRALAYVNKGNTLRKLQRYNEAIQCYNEAINTTNKKQIASDSFFKHFSFGQKSLTDSFIQRLKEEEDFNEKKLAIVYYKIGRCLYSQQNYGEAQQSFTKALLIESKNIDALNFKGLSLCKQQKIQDGIKCFNEALQLNLQFPLALFLKEYYENQSKLDIEKLKDQISSNLKTLSDEQSIQLFIFFEAIECFEPNNEEYLDQIILILKKLEKMLRC